MTWHESTCPFCKTDTSGTLPYTFHMYGRGELHGEVRGDQVVMVQLYPCEEHNWIVEKLAKYEKVKAEDMRRYMERCES